MREQLLVTGGIAHKETSDSQPGVLTSSSALLPRSPFPQHNFGGENSLTQTQRFRPPAVNGLNFNFPRLCCVFAALCPLRGAIQALRSGRQSGVTAAPPAAGRSHGFDVRLGLKQEVTQTKHTHTHT